MTSSIEILYEYGYQGLGQASSTLVEQEARFDQEANHEDTSKPLLLYRLECK